jgi:hypothetical protein
MVGPAQNNEAVSKKGVEDPAFGGDNGLTANDEVDLVARDREQLVFPFDLL